MLPDGLTTFGLLPKGAIFRKDGDFFRKEDDRNSGATVQGPGNGTATNMNGDVQVFGNLVHVEPIAGHDN